jgi:amicoumacin kinase
MPPISPAHLTMILDRFGVRAADAKLLGHSQNQVYGCLIDGQPAVIRISVDRHRTAAQIEAELAWIEDLANQGVPICRPRPSIRGLLCEQIILDGKEYLAVRFDHAPGHRIAPEDINAALYRDLGRITAQLHTATIDRNGSAPYISARPHWHESRLLNEDVIRHTPPHAEPFRACVRQLIDDIRRVPIDPRQYGLLHADISFSNTFVQEGRLTIFDFDNCERGWIAQDFATVLYDSIYCKLVNRVPGELLGDRISQAWGSFRQGYATVREMPIVEPKFLRQFLILREAIIYVHYQRTLDRAKLTESQRIGIDEMRKNVEAGVTLAMPE